jgi:hypothetical protein
VLAGDSTMVDQVDCGGMVLKNCLKLVAVHLSGLRLEEPSQCYKVEDSQQNGSEVQGE